MRHELYCHFTVNNFLTMVANRLACFEDQAFLKRKRQLILLPASGTLELVAMDIWSPLVKTTTKN